MKEAIVYLSSRQFRIYSMIHFELIFTKISLKLHFNLVNSTDSSLLSDFIQNDVKVYLLSSVLEEIKNVSINILFYKSKDQSFSYKLDKLLYLMLVNLKKKITSKYSLLKIKYASAEAKWLLKNLELEDGELIKWAFEELLVKCTNIKCIDISSDRLLISIVESFMLKITDILSYLLILELTSTVTTENTHIDMLCITYQYVCFL